MPAISQPNSSGKDCEYTLSKDFLFVDKPAFTGQVEYFLSSNERLIFVSGHNIVFGSKWRRKYIENGNLVKNKDGDGSFLPDLQRRQNDNMAIPEIQYAVL